MSFSIRTGNFLFKNLYPVYNLIYPMFKWLQDSYEISLLSKNIKPGDVVIDIGANIGFYTRMFSKLVGPGGMVYSFEPDRENFKRLQQNTKGLSNVVLVPKAVSYNSGVIKIYKSPMLNVDHRTYPVDGFTDTEEIESVCLDDFMSSDRKVNFIKMDIQGYESFALIGMAKTLAASPKVKMLTEFWPYGLKEAGSSVREYLGLLEKNGFTVYLLERSGKRVQIGLKDAGRFEDMEKDIYMNVFVTKTPLQ